MGGLRTGRGRRRLMGIAGGLALAAAAAVGTAGPAACTAAGERVVNSRDEFMLEHWNGTGLASGFRRGQPARRGLVRRHLVARRTADTGQRATGGRAGRLL